MIKKRADNSKISSPSPPHPAVSTPATHIPLPPEMCIVLDCLDESIQISIRSVEAARNRWRAYIYQCATALHVNEARFKFDPDKRVFMDNPDYKKEAPVVASPALVPSSVPESLNGLNGSGRIPPTAGSGTAGPGNTII